ncbi:MAG: VWA domain-containing protein [Candidatus Korobacteraceae bacterium]
MFNRRLSYWIVCAAASALLLTASSLRSQEKLPDAPSPQNNAPVPQVSVPTPDTGNGGGESSSAANPQPSPNTRPVDEADTGQQNPQPPPPGSQEIKTIPPGQASTAPGSGVDELYKLIVRVNFVSVPVTVKDHDGHLVEGLLQKDFSIYEDDIPQKITFFTSDPFPLSTALVIDVGLPETTLKKVSQTYSALTGAFGPFDNTAVFTYGNSVTKQSDFGNAQRVNIALNRIRDLTGDTPGPQQLGGPFGSGPTTNGKPVDPGRLQVNTPSRPSSVLNDAILMAAQDLSHQSRESRKIIFVVSNGREYGSRASYEQVLKVLLTQNIAVYAIGVDSAALPGYRELGKLHIPTQGYTDILPKYANATGGDVINEMSREAIESSYQQITLQARNQYTLGYNTTQSPSSKYRHIEVRVKRPGLLVTTKQGYYPLPPPHDKPESAQQTPPGTTPSSPQ